MIQCSLHLTPKAVVCLLLLCLPALAANADTLFLTDGRRIEGEFLEDNGQTVKFNMQGNVLSFSRDKVERIERDDPATKALKEGDKLLAEQKFTAALAQYQLAATGAPEPAARKIEELHKQWFAALEAPLLNVSLDQQEALIRKTLELWTPESGAYVREVYRGFFRDILVEQAAAASNRLDFRRQGAYLEEGLKEFPLDREIAIALIRFYDVNKRGLETKLEQFKKNFQQDAEIQKVVEEILIRHAAESEAINDIDNQEKALLAAIDFNANNCEAVFKLAQAYDKNKIKTDQIIPLLRPCLERHRDRVNEIALFAEYANKIAPFASLEFLFPERKILPQADDKIKKLLPEALLAAFNLKPFPADAPLNRVELYTHYLEWVPPADRAPLFRARAELEPDNPRHDYELGKYSLEQSREQQALEAFQRVYGRDDPLNRLPEAILLDTAAFDFYTSRMLTLDPWKLLHAYYPGRRLHQQATSDSLKWLPEIFLACMEVSPFPEDEVFDKETLYLRYLDFRPVRTVHLEVQTAHLSAEEKEKYLRERIIEWRVREGYEFLIVVKLELQKLLIERADRAAEAGDAAQQEQLLQEAYQILPGNNEVGLKLARFLHEQGHALKPLLEPGALFHRCDPVVETEILKLAAADAP